MDLGAAREVKDLLVHQLQTMEPKQPSRLKLQLEQSAARAGMRGAADAFITARYGGAVRALPSVASARVADGRSGVMGALWGAVDSLLESRHGGAVDVALALISARSAPISIGIAPTARRGDYRIAVRIQDRRVLTSDALEVVRHHAGDDVDVRYIGRINAHGVRPWHQSTMRPLGIGASLAHPSVKAGTLGGFVTSDTGEVQILSANHVVAAENAAKPSDSVLQPGPKDGGRKSRDVVGQLATVVALERDALNLVDCGLVALDRGIDYEPSTLSGAGTLSGPVDDFPDDYEPVEKLGRTTGHTYGRITNFEMTPVRLHYRSAVYAFDKLFEIEGAGTHAFSRPGDSGALVFRSQDRAARGMIIGGTAVGSANGSGLSYATSLVRVLRRLNASLLL